MYHAIRNVLTDIFGSKLISKRELSNTGVDENDAEEEKAKT